jgi:hypothetical protein
MTSKRHARNVQYLWTLIILLSVLFGTFILIEMTLSGGT